jgi:Family of unknown function (DUF6518)
MSTHEALLGLPGAIRSQVRGPKRRRGEIAIRFAIAVTIGLAGGALTQWSILHLPYTLEPLSNSAAPWVVVAFALALSARSIGESLLLAVTSLIALVMGFYLAEALRGWPVSQHQVEFWIVTSVLMGPLIGLAAGWFRRAGRTAGALGAGILGGLLVGEAAHGLIALALSSATRYWDVQIAVGVVVSIGLTLWRFRGLRRGRIPALGVSVAACTLVGLGTLIAYQVS